MKTRSGSWLLLMALLAGISGCAGTSRRDDGSPIFGPRAWNEPPAPPQRPVTLMTDRSQAASSATPHREGLAKYFPGLARDQATAPEPPKVASATSTSTRYRPTWFGLRPPKPANTQTYMTDNRELLNRPGPEPTSLPVALQIPTDRAASDRMVTPVNAESTVIGAPSQPANSTENPAPKVPADGEVASSGELPDFGGKPSKPGEDEINPLPPAAEPGSPSEVANRMPQVPSVDPLASTSTDRPVPRPSPSSPEGAAPDNQTVKASVPPEGSAPPAPSSGSTQSTIQVAQTSKTVVPTSTVLASPQGPPPKSTPQVKPTSQVKPTPQAGATPAKTWQRPCLRRLVRKVCKIGEFADPPTAAPH